MEYILNKKNIPILRYAENKGYIEVLQVYNKEHLPVVLFLNGKPSADNLYALNEKWNSFWITASFLLPGLILRKHWKNLKYLQIMNLPKRAGF